MYVYVQALYGRKIKTMDMLHFIPFAFKLIVLLPFYIQSSSHKLDIIAHYQPGYWAFAFDMLMMVHLLVYGILCLLFQFKKYKNTFPNQGLLHWSNAIVVAYLGFVLSFICYYVMVYVFEYNRSFDYMISVAMSVFIYLIGYLGFRYNDIYSITSAGKKSPKYANSGLTKQESEEHLNKLLTLMQDEKPYLDSELKMGDLAQKLNIPVHHLSQIINEQLEQNYADFINSYRIKEAQEKLISPVYDHLKIIAIAYDVGFNTKASFNTAFRKFTGMSPSEYRDKEKQEFLTINTKKEV